MADPSSTQRCSCPAIERDLTHRRYLGGPVVITHEHSTYAFLVVGHLDDRWSTWFADLTIARNIDGTCTLIGEVADQSQLHGILARIRDIGATLLALHTIGAEDSTLSVEPAVQVHDPGARPLGDC